MHEGEWKGDALFGGRDCDSQIYQCYIGGTFRMSARNFLVRKEGMIICIYLGIEKISSSLTIRSYTCVSVGYSHVSQGVSVLWIMK